MTYKILEDVELNLSNVNAKALKVCKNLGLLNAGGRITKDEQDLIVEALKTQEDGKCYQALEIFKRNPVVDEMGIYLNPEKLFLLIKSIFVVPDVSKIEQNLESVDLGVVVQATYDFLGKLTPSSLRSQDLLKTLMDSIQRAGTAN